MLTHALDYVRKCEFEKAVQANGGNAEGINPEEPTEEFIRFRDNHLFGAEISRPVMHVARVNTLMNGAQYADLKVMDSLAPLSSITGGITEGLPNRPGFYPGGLTMVLTNPPFGSKVTNPRVLKDFAARGGVTKRNGTIVNSLPQEVAFVNRCLEYLAPGGKLAIVLPDGVLANSSMQYIRDWILRWARLKAIISLPQETFAPYGAGVKTSLVFLEKRAFPLPPEGQLELGQVMVEEEDNYEVYMARINNIGYDATGRLTVPESEASLPPEVAETIEDFHSRLGWK
jgi:type I restriction enzyme M protein